MKLVGTLLLLACVGCHAAKGSETGQSSAQSGSETRAETQVASAEACCTRCPLALPGVELKFAQTTGGGSMLFTAPNTELGELRERVRELAAYHNREQGRLAMVTMPHQAEAVTIDNGAQLVLTTQINNDVQVLQQEVENEVQWMQGGHCPGAGELECHCSGAPEKPLSSAASSEGTPPPQ